MRKKIKTKEFKRYIQVIKPDNRDEKICNNLDEYDIIVEECKDEKELLLKWKKLINRMNLPGSNQFKKAGI